MRNTSSNGLSNKLPKIKDNSVSKLLMVIFLVYLLHLFSFMRSLLRRL